MSQTPILTGQDIAEAYGAVEVRLEQALSATGTTNREYVVLRVLAARPFESPARLHKYLAGQRELASAQPLSASCSPGSHHARWPGVQQRTTPAPPSSH